MKTLLAILVLIVGFSVLKSQKEKNLSMDYPSLSDESNPVLIVGLGEFRKEDLRKSKEILNEVFQLETKISSPKNTENSLYHLNSDTLVAEKVLNELKVGNRKVIYITSEPLVSKSSEKLRGMTHLGGSVVVVRGGEHLRETLIHEIGHTYGLNHCEDLTCIMAIQNDDMDSGEFCRKCKKKLNNLKNTNGTK